MGAGWPASKVSVVGHFTCCSLCSCCGCCCRRCRRRFAFAAREVDSAPTVDETHSSSNKSQRAKMNRGPQSAGPQQSRLTTSRWLSVFTNHTNTGHFALGPRPIFVFAARFQRAAMAAAGALWQTAEQRPGPMGKRIAASLVLCVTAAADSSPGFSPPHGK